MTVSNRERLCAPPRVIRGTIVGRSLSPGRNGDHIHLDQHPRARKLTDGQKCVRRKSAARECFATTLVEILPRANIRYIGSQFNDIAHSRAMLPKQFLDLFVGVAALREK